MYYNEMHLTEIDMQAKTNRIIQCMNLKCVDHFFCVRLHQALKIWPLTMFIKKKQKKHNSNVQIFNK